MKATTFALILLSILTGTCLTSCIDDDFTTNPSHVLAFSTDTVAFDTVFTTIGTSTRSFRIYNRNKKSLNISSIKLADAEHSGFHINVDGMSGDNFTNVEIRGKDSLYVFVEANIDPTNQDNPIFIIDSIVFVTNGVQQDVKLTAYGQDVIIKRGETFTTDTHLTDERPYLIYDSLVVAPGATLQIEPGARLHFHHRASLLVQGKLQVEGSMEAPVQIRGDRLDRLFADLPYDNLGGQWGGIRFYPESFGNKISYAYVRGMTSGIVLDSCASEEPRLEIANSRIRNSSGNLITSVYSRLNCWNSELSDAGGAILSLTGGIADFTHCTIVNYYFYDIITSPIVNMSYCAPADTISGGPALLRARFNNSILYGNTSEIPRSTSPAAMYISVPASSVPTEKTMTISSIPYGTDNRFSKPLAKNITTTIIESGRINPMLSGKETPISRSSHWIKICMGTFVPRAWISELINTYHKKFPKNRECT